MNAVSPYGGRTSAQVKKQLADLKAKTKKKTAEMRRHREGTGVGSPFKSSFLTTEELLLTTMNPQTIDGIIEDGDSSILIVLKSK